MRSLLLKPRLVCLIFLMFVPSSIAEDRSYGRSMVVTPYGMVATSYVQASQAGARILEQGGSAIDAGIAANAVLGVAEPMMNGIGGDLFAIYWEAKTGKLYGLNASGWAPKALTIDHLRAKGITEMPQAGIDSVTIPGVVDGWTKLHDRFGKLPWATLFQPAIAYAKQGYPLPEALQSYWEEATPRLAGDAESRRVFLPNGKSPELGQIFSNPDLAQALTLIADKGESAFYKGGIAQAILKTSASHGGAMTADDLSEFSAQWVDPVSTTYRDWKVYELPPNGDGIAALEMLNIMEQSQPAPDGPLSTAELHTRIEAMKLAYADVKAYDGDPRFSTIPVSELLSKAFAAKRAPLIDPGKANCTVAPGALSASDTTYLTIVDREGNILSLIQSNYSAFGSGVTVEDMGFVLQNRGGLFSFDTKSPNALAGHKRPFHTIIPGFMERGREHIGFGIMGGMNQPLAHAQFVSNVVDYHMNVQAAMEEARFTVSGKLGCSILIESRVPPETLQQLTAMGHVLNVRKQYSTTMGRGQAILYDSASGIKYGASDPRADGAAIPEAPPRP
ncbi:gamma-glutamyltransferase [Alloacidobacterium dinghuense]|uniref:Glutathione hydrolase proenzyme n=1 Tax=Alloacidobacterium dinghuense TaxID=2763107 RepID=A0A7G8BE32_9BACT|nr:gamma-glutamyltransferase [Alloacidobacterium dinghuense]QNI30802.1 gamma-glutamyltransferase [Alloacidobacterium dinghuense]